VLAVFLLDAVLITHNAAQQQEQFAQRAEYQTLLLASLAVPYINSGDTTELINLLRNAVVGDLLYAQVVVNGQIIAERLAPEVGQLTLSVEPIPLTTEDQRGVIRRSRSSSNGSYLDLRLGLMPLVAQRDGHMAGADPTTTYIRLGYSLDWVNLEVNRSTLFTAGVSVVLLVVIGLLIWLAVRVFQVRHPLPKSATDSGAQEMLSVQPLGSDIPERTPGNGVNAAGPKGRILHLRGGEVLVDEERKSIAFDGRQVALSPKEYKLFMQLVSEPSRTFADEEIIQAVWGARASLPAKMLSSTSISCAANSETVLRRPSSSKLFEVTAIGWRSKRFLSFFDGL